MASGTSDGGRIEGGGVTRVLEKRKPASGRIACGRIWRKHCRDVSRQCLDRADLRSGVIVLEPLVASRDGAVVGDVLYFDYLHL